MATPSTGLTIRVDGDPAKITAAVRAAIREADPNIPLFQIRTMEEPEPRLLADGLFGVMFSMFGLVALFLASIGVYGVLSARCRSERRRLASVSRSARIAPPCCGWSSGRA